MSESNGKPVSLRDVIAEHMGQVQAGDDSLLRDMLSDYPQLRLAVMGGPRAGHVWPMSTLKIARSGNDICVVLECAALEVERRTYSKSLFGALEILEQDLETQPGGWTPNWKGRQRLERQLLT